MGHINSLTILDENNVREMKTQICCKIFGQMFWFEILLAVGSIPNQIYQFQNLSIQIVGTPSTYMEYLLWVLYMPSRIVMEEIFSN